MTASKVLSSAASGAAAGAGLDVEDVFSTYLYVGEIDGTQADGYTRKIPNGLDLSTEGGLVWLKRRDLLGNNYVYDTERTAQQYLVTQSDSQQASDGDAIQYETDGFSFLKNSYNQQYTPYEYASWSFRQAEGFMDIQTYTGNGTSGRTISHNLGSTPGWIVIKRTDATADWAVYHRAIDASSPENYYLKLNENVARGDSLAYWNHTAPTSTTITLGNGAEVNANNGSYVAYIFAHHDGDGTFGADADLDIIHCGSYTGNGSSTDREIDVGFQPQWLLIKRRNATEDWHLMDTMRGMPTGIGGSPTFVLEPNDIASEISPVEVFPYANGFVISDSNPGVNGNNDEYIYVAIRSGTRIPDDIDDVFTIDPQQATSGAPAWDTTHPVDFVFYQTSTGGAWYTSARPMNTEYLILSGTDATASSSAIIWDFNDGVFSAFLGSYQAWMWKKARGFCDTVSWLGNATNRTIPHDLGVVPEMIWAKSRDRAGEPWYVYHSATGETEHLHLNTTAPSVDALEPWNDTAPTASNFSINNTNGLNNSGSWHIAMLFATIDGVSKVGSYTGNGTNQNIECGFSAGASFVIIKRTDATGNWSIFDTTRGIVAGNDNRYDIVGQNAEDTNDDSIDPYNGGFNIVQESAANLNVSGASYIFYALA